MNFFILLISFLLINNTKNLTPTEDETIIMNVYYSKTSGKFTAKKSDKIDNSAIASATYINSYETKGWDFLTISSYSLDDNKYTDANKAYAMGYVEGIINNERIYQIYQNLLYYSFYSDGNKMPENLRIFLEKNLEYMKQKSYENKDKDVYWEHVYYIYQQLLGLYDGYNSACPENKKLGFVDRNYRIYFVTYTLFRNGKSC